MKAIFKLISIFVATFLITGCSCSFHTVQPTTQSTSTSVNIQDFYNLPKSKDYYYLCRNRNGEYTLTTNREDFNVTKYYKAYFDAFSQGYQGHSFDRNNPFIKDELFFHVVYGLPYDPIFTYYDFYKQELVIYKILTYKELYRMTSMNNSFFEFERGYSDLQNIDYIMHVTDIYDNAKDFEIIFDIESYEIRYFGDVINNTYDENEEIYKRIGCRISSNEHDYPVLNFDNEKITLSPSYLKENAEYSELTILNEVLSIRTMCFGKNLFVQFTPARSDDLRSNYTTLYLFNLSTKKLKFLSYFPIGSIVSVIPSK